MRYRLGSLMEEVPTEKLPAVENARQLMTEAMGWSVMKWLREKKLVRKTADQANAALDQLDRELKMRWPEDLRTAYDALAAQPEANNGHKKAADSKTLVSARHMKDADIEAQRARMNAEKTFDDAEKQLSTSLAREGCRKAIESWNLHEKAIRKSEALIPPQ
jgi:hypothetical protein